MVAPITLPVADSRVVGRPTGEDLTDMTVAETKTLLDISDVTDAKALGWMNALIRTASSVKMIWVGPASTDWLVFARGGNEIDISLSTTTGFQEAASAMDTASGPDANLYIEGLGTITCADPVIFPVLNTQKIYMDSGVINFAGANIGANPGIRFQTTFNCDIEMLGKIVYTGSGPCILMKPEGVTELVTVISDSRFKFTTLDAIGSGSNNATGIEVDRANGSVLGIEIEALKIDVQGDTGGKGFVIKDSVGGGFVGNTVNLKDVREANIGLQEGETNGDSIAQNTYNIYQSTTKGTNPIGMQLHGQDGDYTYNLNTATTGSVGVQLESAAKRGTLRILSNAGITPIVDNSDKSSTFIVGRIASWANRNGVDTSSFVTATWNVLPMNTDELNIGLKYHAALFKWTPEVLGMAAISGRGGWNATTDGALLGIGVFKNGTVKVTNTDISFTSNNQIDSASSEFGSYAVGDWIEVIGTASNDGKYDIATASAATLTTTQTTIVNETAGASMTLEKQPIKSSWIRASGTGSNQGPELNGVKIYVEDDTDYFDIYVRQETGVNQIVGGDPDRTYVQFERIN